ARYARIAGEEHERGAIAAAESADDFLGGVTCLGPPVAVAHARGVIEQDHHLARAARRDRVLPPREEGTRKGGDEERERGAAQQKQQQVTKLLPAHGAIRD